MNANALTTASRKTCIILSQNKEKSKRGKERRKDHEDVIQIGVAGSVQIVPTSRLEMLRDLYLAYFDFGDRIGINVEAMYNAQAA